MGGDREIGVLFNRMRFWIKCEGKDLYNLMVEV